MNQLSTSNAETLKLDATQFLTFQVSGETLAIAILDVMEIIEIEEITKVPMMPACILGIINLRGRVVPVVDLARRLSRTQSKISKKSCIVLVEVEHKDNSQTIGMLVEEVNEIIEIEDQNTQPPPDFGTNIRTNFIRSMGRVDDRFIILLNVHNVMSVEDLSLLTQMEAMEADSIME